MGYLIRNSLVAGFVMMVSPGSSVDTFLLAIIAFTVIDMFRLQMESMNGKI